MNELISSILARNDAGESDVAKIAKAEGKSIGYVYGVLREHRPQRVRKPRKRTSEKRQLILGLLAMGHQAPRVAVLAQCTPAYVYKLMGER
ncbi:hypothetical protein AOQ73_05760 [Bradyrhizobium pachyrhizi]|uniref:hypothetical protein n=1 Tax=Bradyrhizobium pachyrhizi TaxID=280333 RepID=UPI000704C27F|nr:hypothetical protein [Bradyrhizobium pachyrhizi]KRQ11913.1 hypothetical protein AOQ73_05760 [Bradyrhizobium pachyrhizi]